jgi:pimeloyl-ACP methyl ester carboxylesterase
MVDDTVSLLELLHDRFGRKTFVAGFSFGATFAVQAAVRRPDVVAALVATGIDIDMPSAETRAYTFVLSTARERGNRRAIRQLERIGPPPHLDGKRFSTRARWVANFGGVTVGATYSRLLRMLLASLLRSPGYSVTGTVRTVRGMTASQAALLPELATTDLVRTVPRLDVPIVLAQGRLDQSHPATPRSGSMTPSPHPASSWCGSRNQRTHPNTTNPPSSVTYSSPYGPASVPMPERLARRSSTVDC